MQDNGLNVRLNSLLLKELDKVRKGLNLSRSEFVRLSLKNILERYGRGKLVYDVVNDKFRVPKGGR